jgi:hypothetical protein
MELGSKMTTKSHLISGRKMLLFRASGAKLLFRTGGKKKVFFLVENAHFLTGQKNFSDRSK